MNSAEMAIIEEEGGRLNTFAKEPRMEVLNQEVSPNNSSRFLIVILGAALVVGLIAITVVIS